VTVDAATNRLTGTGISYDVAGNQVNNGTYGYDSLNMMTSKVGSANEGTSWYVYTPDDERIGVLQPAIDKWNWTLRGFDHDVLREFQSSNSTPASAWVWIEDHAYRGSGLLLSAERPPAEGGQRHFHLDHLGTPRLVTGLNGGLVALHDYAPYGAEITSPCQEKNLGFDREEPHRFTVHERDFAGSCADTTALDYMHARTYSAITKRFLSVDSSVVLSTNITTPQRWNRYSYTGNNPLARVHLNGLEWFAVIEYFGTHARHEAIVWIDMKTGKFGATYEHPRWADEYIGPYSGSYGAKNGLTPGRFKFLGSNFDPNKVKDPNPNQEYLNGNLQCTNYSEIKQGGTLGYGFWQSLAIALHMIQAGDALIPPTLSDREEDPAYKPIPVVTRQSKFGANSPSSGDELPVWMQEDDWLYGEAFGTEIVLSRHP
jgi:RHS repeat-associated protein